MDFPKYDGVPDGIDGVSFEEIYELFADSSYGKKLEQAVRYAPFKPQEVSNEEWIEILGPSVSNLEHLKVVLEEAQQFLYRCASPHKEWNKEIPEEAKFSKQEQELLCLTAVIHDWAEAEVGDIPWPEKTTQHQAEELKMLKQQIDEFCRKRVYEHLTPKMYMGAKIAFNQDDRKLGEAFNAIENIDYWRTALRAWSQRLNFEGHLSDNLIALAGDVVKNRLIAYKEQAKIYPATHYFIFQNRQSFGEVIDYFAMLTA